MTRSRMVTLEVFPETRIINEALGYRNRPLRNEELRVVETWANQEGLTLSI